jgi:hypothetical protein
MARRFRFAAVSVLVMAGTGLAACGSSDSTPDAASLLKDAFGPNHSVKSGNLGVQLVLDAKGLKNINGPVSLKLSGPFESQGKGKVPKLDLALTITGSGANFSAGAVTTSDKAWIKLQGTAFLVDDPTYAKFKQSYEQAASKSGNQGQTLKSLGVDPLKWLQAPKVAGTEEAGGAETYRITSGVDVDAFLQDVSGLLGKAGKLGGSTTAALPSGLTPKQRQEIAASVKNAALQIWIGKDDKTLRRLKIDIDIDVPPAIRPRAGGLSTGTLAFDLQIADLNQPQTITAPQNARPLSDLKQLISGGATGGSQTPPATTTTPAAPSGGGSKYLDCVNKAGTDVRAIQKCAALVGQ